MGYDTDFEGQVEVDPPLTAEHVQELIDFADERHGGGADVYTGFPGFWCKWEPIPDGTAIEWNGCEKFYDGTEWMQYLITHFLEPWGHTCNGVINAQGEDQGDIWRIVVKDNNVEEQRAKVSYDYE